MLPPVVEFLPLERNKRENLEDLLLLVRVITRTTEMMESQLEAMLYENSGQQDES